MPVKLQLLTFLLIATASVQAAGNWISIEDSEVLSESEIGTFEDKMWQYVSTEWDGEFVERSKYTYQYLLRADGTLIVGALCIEVPPAELKKRFYEVDGGGECFFTVWYDYSNQEFDGLFVNFLE